jgi:hypothetical protein
MLAFRWGTSAWSGIGGLAAGLSILLQPRLFGHAHFAATETPLMTFWFAATLAGWWAVERDRRMGWILAGICWGLAIGTKFTGLAALGPVALYGLWRRPRRSATGILVAAAVAVVAFSALNPMMWVAARQFLGRWVWESLHRADYVPILTFYLGRRYGFDVPWHHVFVMTAVVLPIAIAVLAAVGGVAGLRRRDPVVILCAGTVVFVWMIFLLPRAPHHDGVRQFIMLFPFLGMLAGYGVHRATEVFGERVSGLILAAAFLPAAGQIAAYHPYYLSYYSEGVGGLRGAHAMGFETTYWQDAYTGPVLDFLNEELPQGSSVFVNGETLSLVFQQGIGRLRRDLRFTNVLPSDYVLAQMRRSTRGEDLIPGPEFGPPAYLLQHQGVPLVVIYRFRDGVIPEFGQP